MTDNLPNKKSLLLFLFLLVLVIGGTFIGPESFAQGEATLSLTTSSATPGINEIFEITVALNTAGLQTSGADVILVFDQERLEAQEIIEGKIFPYYIYKNIDSQNGRVNLSAIIGLDASPFSGQGNLAKIKFKAKAQGATQIDFDFTPGNKNDSNVARFDTPEDILGEAKGISLTLGEVTPSSTPTPKPADGGNGGGGDSGDGEPPSAAGGPASGKKGDIDGNGKVDIFDLSRLLSKWGKTADLGGADLSGDGKVDIFDLSILLSNWGK